MIKPLNALDAEVYEAICRGETTYHGVIVSVRQNAAGHLPDDLSRPVDRSLQRLRKMGLISFVGGGVGWQTTNTWNSAKEMT